MATLKQAHGNWVAGEDRFWNRDAETKLFEQYIDDGANLYLVAQRRIGKTSLMREMARRLEKRYTCLHVDLQDAASSLDFVAALSAATHPHKTLWAKTREVFGNALGTAAGVVESLQIQEIQLKIREGLLQSNWENKGEQLLAGLAAAEQPVVVFMDEVPIMVNRILKGSDTNALEITPERVAATDEFMSWLRAQTIRHNGQIRFVVTGSIGFEPILRQAELSATINHLRPFYLDPWKPETAIGCLEALAQGYRVAFLQGATERVVERLGSCIPHHVQMFFGNIHEDCERRRCAECSVEDVDRVYEERMLSSRGHAELSTFEERLRLMVGRKILPFTLELLTEAAVAGHLSPDAIRALQREFGLADRDGMEQTREVIGILEHDGYLRDGAGGLTFTSTLLRDWWKRRFGAFGYTPALQRES